jgi:oxygen-dependent protoporphyrinogen oxidase
MWGMGCETAVPHDDSLPVPSHVPAPSHVIIVGGGLAGLAAAEAVVAASDRPGRRITLVEAAGRTGGVLGTVRRGGWLVERSADCFLAARPEGLALVDRLGLHGELVGVDPRVRRALVWHQGRTVPVPLGFRLLAPGRVEGILHSSLLSPAGRLRLLGERFVPRRLGGEEESLEQFATRRLGREAFERLVQPLAAGIWTADPARLGMASACGEFLEMERGHGSLWAGERARLRAAKPAAAAAGARYGQFVTFAGGMQTLTDRLTDHLRSRGVIFHEGRGERLDRSAGEWRLTVSGADGRPETLLADAVIVATRAPAAAVLLAGVDADLAAELAGIAYAGSAIVSLGFPRAAVAHPLDAAGLVVPRITGRRALAVSFSSSKFPGRAPPGRVLVRVFLGGALDPETLALDDAALAAVAVQEAGELLGAAGEPELVQIDRWAGGMPQYHVGHADRVARIESAVAGHPGLALAGAAYRGVGIPQVIASGQAAARRVCG